MPPWQKLQFQNKKLTLAPNIQIFRSKLHIFVPSSQMEFHRFNTKEVSHWFPDIRVPKVLLSPPKKWISIVNFQMFFQLVWSKRWKVRLVAFLGFVSRVSFQMCPQIACLNRCIVTLVAFVGFFSRVSFSRQLPKQMHSRIGCICMIFLQNEFLNVPSNCTL